MGVAALGLPVLLIRLAVLAAEPAGAVDSDGDGVADAADVCCNTPAGTEVDAEGRPRGDIDLDCDVDLVDYGILAAGFTGPLDPCIPEVCDGLDNDCDCAVDEDFPFLVDPRNCGACGVICDPDPICIGGMCAAFEGFGSVTSGGAAGEVYVVTSLSNSGPGTLREAITDRIDNGGGGLIPRTVVFAVSGEIWLESELEIAKGLLTVAGSTAPAPGITIRTMVGGGAMVLRNVEDVILTHLRFIGHQGTSDIDNLSVRGGRRVVIDHITSASADDGALDITWNGSFDVTVSWSLFYGSITAMAISFGPNGRLSLHHNVWANNRERNPQLRYQNDFVDYVNNVVYHWGTSSSGYGLRVRVVQPEAGFGDGATDANVINNVFSEGAHRTDWALVYGGSPGTADDGGPLAPYPQGMLWTSADGSLMGNIYVAGNILPDGNQDHYSTIAEPLPIPPEAQVTTYPADQLGTRVVPFVGMLHRTQEEQDLLDEIQSALE